MRGERALRISGWGLEDKEPSPVPVGRRALARRNSAF